MFLSEWCRFHSAPCVAEKKNLVTASVSMLLKSRSSLTCFRACFLPFRAKDLSAPWYISKSSEKTPLSFHLPNIENISKNGKIKIYRTIILPAVLYGCETWSLTLREERKLRVFENMVLRRIF